MKKRFFTIVLCLVLCLAVLPMAAFADETEEEVECFHESTYYEATEEGHVAHCADCGAVFSMESHNFMGVSDSDRHWIRCVDCEYCTHFGEHGNCTEQDVDYCLYCNALREECTTWLTEHKDADGDGFCDLCGAAVVPETPHEDGWAQNDAGKWEYYENGVAVIGWKKVSGKWYYLGSNGIMQTGWQLVDGKWYYLKASGEMQTGWQQIGGKWYYLGSDGAMKTKWQQIGGKWYYLGSDGAMQTGWQQIGGKWYYLGSDGAMRTGWQQVGKKWYYLGSDGIMQTKWQQIGGKWYYLGSDGAMCTKWQQVGKKWYYLGADGAMQTGWQEIGGVWYYLGSDGAMQTGWQKIGKKWYYLGSDGAMRTDWQKVGGEWYYLGADGAMRTDWQKIGKKWYYFGPDGVMWTEIHWIADSANNNVSTYSFGADGAMVTGWYCAGDSWLYFDADGRGHTGWLEDNGRTYYCSEGWMCTGWVNTADGWHKFAADGHLVDLPLTNNQKKNANKVDNISYYLYPFYDGYELTLYFKDADNYNVTVSGFPFFVNVQIINDNGEFLLDWSDDFEAAELWTDIDIDKSIISYGNSESGTMYLTVSVPGCFDYSATIAINDLPLYPPTIVLMDSLPIQLDDCKITDISLEFNSYNNATFDTTFYFTGTRTKYSTGTAYCHIPWELYDSDGYVVDSGSCLSPSLLYGESFRDAKGYAFDLKATQTYYLKFLN